MVAGGSRLIAAAAGNRRIVDTHIHLYDPARPQGVPWPPKDNAVLYKPHLIADYKQATRGLGVTGAIAVEASPLLEDNDWVLKLTAKDPLILGLVGNIAAANLPAQLERLHKNRRFLGIRRGRSALSADDLRLLAAAGLTLDVLGDPGILPDVLRLSDRLPNLRIVMDHLPYPPVADLREFAKRPNVYAKVSWILRKVNGRVPEDLAVYRADLDRVWDVFGANRVIYGSNWPVSNLQAPYASVLRIAREYFESKGAAAADRYFWKNSQAAYRWSS